MACVVARAEKEQTFVLANELNGTNNTFRFSHTSNLDSMGMPPLLLLCITFSSNGGSPVCSVSLPKQGAMLTPSLASTFGLWVDVHKNDTFPFEIP